MNAVVAKVRISASVVDDYIMAWRRAASLAVPKGKNRLSDGQKEFIQLWRGQVRVVRSVDGAIRLVTEAYG